MFLQRLRICNFRGFYGEQVVEFAPVSETEASRSFTAKMVRARQTC